MTNALLTYRTAKRLQPGDRVYTSAYGAGTVVGVERHLSISSRPGSGEPRTVLLDVRLEVEYPPPGNDTGCVTFRNCDEHERFSVAR